MEAYRVLLVDDEEELRAGIRRKIDWDSLGFSLCGEAGNGQDALELAEHLNPDVVLTDIKMPFMDGLELCRRLKEQLPAVRLIVFSGFDDFEYARQAIGMNVFEYLLKPINALELSQVLARLHADMDTQRAEQQDVQALRQRYEDSLPLLRGLFYARVLDGQLKPSQISERAARYEISLNGDSWVTARIHVSALGDDPDELILLSVQGFFQENFSLSCCDSRWLLYDDDLALLASFPGTVQIYSLIHELERVRAMAEKVLRLKLTVGIGAPVNDFSQLMRSAQGASSALDYRMLLGTGRTLYIGDLEPRQTGQLTFGESDERELINAVKLGTPDTVRQFLGDIIQSARETTLSQYQCFFLELLTCLIKLARAADIPIDSVFGPGFSGAVQLTDFSSPEELGHWVEERCLRLQTVFGQRRTDTTLRAVDKARTFIAQHYTDTELSVEMLCDHLHLSPAYFSTLFKRETGMSFTAYVTNVRMDAAAELLRNTDEKTYLIAQQIGYLDPNYFSYVFKRQYGTSPSKYRAEHRQSTQ